MNVKITLALLLALALPSAAFTQDLDQKVTFESAGVPAPKLIEALGKATGLSLSATSSVDRDVLAVKVKDVSLRDLLDRIAKVENATWLQSGKLLTLKRTLKQASDEKEADRAGRAALIKQAIQKQSVQLEKRPVFDSKAADQVARELAILFDSYRTGEAGPGPNDVDFEMKMPHGRCLVRLLRSIDPQIIADMKPDDQVVFSTTPTRTQRPLGADAAKVLSDMSAEQGIWVSAFSKQADTFRELLDDEGSEGPMQMFAPLKAPVVRAVMIVTRDTDDQIGVRLYLLNARREVAMQVYKDLDEEPQTPSIPPKEAVTIELSTRSKEIVDALAPQYSKNRTRAIEMKDPSQGLLEFLTSCDQNEPLGTIPSDVAFSLASQTKANLVALLPDEAMNLVFRLASEPSMTEDDIAEAGVMSIAKQDGWLLLTPKWRSIDREQRCDRKALSGYLKRLAFSTVPVSSDEIGAFAQVLPDPSANTLMWIYTPLLRSALLECRSWKFMHFYGQLDPRQKAAILDGKRVSIGELTGTQLASLGDVVYSANASLSTPDTVTAFATSLEFEATEALPNGLIPGGWITGQPAVSDIVMGDGRFWFGGAMDAATVAWYLYGKETAKPNMPTITDYHLAKLRDCPVTVQLTPNLTMTESLMDYDKGPAIPYEQLPAEFRDGVDKAMKQLRESAAKRKARTPPPPSKKSS